MDHYIIFTDSDGSRVEFTLDPELSTSEALREAADMYEQGEY